MNGFISVPGGWEWMIIGVIALLLFGKRLPEVARSLGKGMVEFKRGLRGIQDEVEQAVDAPPKLDADRPANATPPAADQNQTNGAAADTHDTTPPNTP